MKIIFLDIDGVLINIESLRNGNIAAPSCVAALNDLIDHTGAKIVVSSVWRKWGLGAMRRQLRQWGITGDVIDITPDLDRFEKEVFISASRGDEIDTYLRDHPEIKSYVIIDDDQDMNDLSKLVRTRYETGLTDEDVQMAISILREERN